LRIRDASWPVVLLVASAWSFATNDEGWGYVGLLVAGLYLAVMASAFRLRRSKEDLAGPEGEE
jgi:hypothetical protein